MNVGICLLEGAEQEPPHWEPQLPVTPEEETRQKTHLDSDCNVTDAEMKEENLIIGCKFMSEAVASHDKAARKPPPPWRVPQTMLTNISALLI